MALGNPRAIFPYPAHLARGLALTAASCVVACTTSSDPARAECGLIQTTGVVASIDTQPWTYDGSAIVEVDTVDRERLQVQLPARWNLCQAAPVDVEALAVGTRVELVAAATDEEDVVVVCADAAHRLAPVAAG
ncbi:conserved hypothetical protein [Luteimonas sp. 9C]|uniref:hypothetical protein n=1 Tax=Luteimonas sp. 9C TaxID=2653148 RepID=UPI0012EF042D|nr:hypothetical protein [Luteimonas sp. 9C]VXB33100.1 conserved hypothetical protein [Luteimonas sp. 9C]